MLQEVGIAEDDHFVAFLAGYISDIEKTHVHADAADDGDLLMVDGDATVAVA